jgi:hypothetical protein
MSLLYITGEELDTLIELHVGKEGVFSENGVYRRLVRIPSDAWQANKEQMTDLDDVASEMVLELPGFISDYMNELISVTQTKKTLGAALGFTSAQAIEIVQSELVKVRACVLYGRITLKRLSAALSLESTLMYDDPTITFQLSSKQNHAAPMLNYYVAHKIDTLEKCYKKITHEMVSV